MRLLKSAVRSSKYSPLKVPVLDNHRLHKREKQDLRRQLRSRTKKMSLLRLLQKFLKPLCHLRRLQSLTPLMWLAQRPLRNQVRIKKSPPAAQEMLRPIRVELMPPLQQLNSVSSEKLVSSEVKITSSLPTPTMASGTLKA